MFFCVRGATDKGVAVLQAAKQVSQVSGNCETVPGMPDNRSATREALEEQTVRRLLSWKKELEKKNLHLLFRCDSLHTYLNLYLGQNIDL